jgi:hypothetical protein
MVIYKTIEEIKEKFCILDSIICDVRWDENLLDLLITIDYYIGKSSEVKLYVIRMKYCNEAHFKMPKQMKKVLPKENQTGYIWSWYTAFAMDIEKKESLEINIITNEDNKWLHAKCEEVWIEEKENMMSEN